MKKQLSLMALTAILALAGCGEKKETFASASSEEVGTVAKSTLAKLGLNENYEAIDQETEDPYAKFPSKLTVVEKITLTSDDETFWVENTEVIDKKASKYYTKEAFSAGWYVNSTTGDPIPEGQEEAWIVMGDESAIMTSAYDGDVEEQDTGYDLATFNGYLQYFILLDILGDDSLTVIDALLEEEFDPSAMLGYGAAADSTSVVSGFDSLVTDLNTIETSFEKSNQGRGKVYMHVESVDDTTYAAYGGEMSFKLDIEFTFGNLLLDSVKISCHAAQSFTDTRFANYNCDYTVVIEKTMAAVANIPSIPAVTSK